MSIKYIIDNAENSLGTQSIFGTVSVGNLTIDNIQSTSGLANYVVVDGDGNTFYQTGGGGLSLVENGLTSSGGVVSLGGNLNQNTLINGSNFNLNFNGLNNFSLTSSSVGFNSNLLVTTTQSRIKSADLISGEYTYLLVENDLLSLQTYNPGTGYFTGVNISSYGQLVGDGSGSAIVINDPLLQKGISYLGDYTGNFTTYSLVTKGYVDSVSAGSSGTSGQSGSSGTSGNDGSSGTSGNDGSSGTSGNDGSSGTSGNDGSSGTSGVSGSSGTSGKDGTFFGSSGTSGNNGTSGTSGNNGTSGTSGNNGTSGTSGNNGTSGTSGNSGSSGTSGNNGTSGTSGNNGTSGTSGNNGTSGTSGNSGSSGTSGNNGTSGTSGNSGSSGTSGNNGTSGTSGNNGTSGTSGNNGTSGTSGNSGSSGTSGNNGTSGTSGNNGTSGTSGNSGSSGTSGINGTSTPMTAASIAYTWGIGDGGSVCMTGNGESGTWQLVSEENIITPEVGGTYSCFVLRVCCVPSGGN